MSQTQTHEGRKKIKTDIYERVTNHIIAELEKGVRPWLKQSRFFVDLKLYILPCDLAVAAN